MAFVLQVTQSWRGVDSEGNILPLHWSLTFQKSVQDGEPIGNLYNAAGNIDTFHYEALFDVPIRNVNWRGDLVVCTFSADKLPLMEDIFSQTPVIRLDSNWNCQNWVWTSLWRLRQSGFDVKPNMNWQSLCNNMSDLLDVWEAGDI